MDLSEEKAKMNRGELYYSFTPELLSDRARASAACHAFNTASAPTQIERVNLWNQYVQFGLHRALFPLRFLIYSCQISC